MAGKPEKKIKEPEGQKHAPKPKKPRHPLLAAAAIGATLIGGSCAPSARAQETTPSRPAAMVQSPDVRVASAEVREPQRGAQAAPSRPQPVVAQAPAQTQVRSDATPDVGERHYDGGGAIIGPNTPVSQITQQEYREQIEYMFDLTAQYEVRPGLNEVRDRVRTVRLAGQEFKVLDGIVVDDNSYITDEFVVRRSTNLIRDMSPEGSIVIYVRNNLDGVRPTNPPTPLIWTPSRADNPNDWFRVYRFRTTPTPVVGREVIAVLEQGGVSYYYFNPLVRKYTTSGTSYGPDFFGPNQRIGVELNEQDPSDPYVSIVIARNEDFLSGNTLNAGSRFVLASLGLVGKPSADNGRVAVNYADLDEIRQ